MSAPLTILLEAGSVFVLPAGSEANDTSAVIELPWSPDAPDAMVDALRGRASAAGGIVIVVGLAFLEIADPGLPPIDADAKRAVLWRDADRYFPLTDEVAAVAVDDLALAMPALQLESFVRALRTLAPIRAVVTAPQLATRLLGSGSAVLPAAAGEHGPISVSNTRLVSLRRVRDGSAPDGTPAPRAKPADTPLIGPLPLLREARAWRDVAVAHQLLHPALAAAFRRQRQARWITSGVVAIAALLVLIASADRFRASQLRWLESRAEALAQQAEPARRAETRRARAQSELALLADAQARQHAPDAPLVVLAQLGRVLPRDAFVQRLEWDGQQWRAEGTADNAPRLVPLLDGDSRFRDVRIAAASQRFLDAGRVRESFAISFRMRAPGTAGSAGGTDDTP